MRKKISLFLIMLIIMIGMFPLTAFALWNQQQKLNASDPGADDNFGYSVSVSGDYAIIGAPFDDDDGSDSGSAYIFKRSGSTWSQIKKLTAGDAAGGDEFGKAVDISGDYAVVGADSETHITYKEGAVYVFKKDNGGSDNWGQIKKLTASDAYTSDYFGTSVSIQGNYLIAGAIDDDDNGGGSGSAYIFYKDEGGTDNWGQKKKILAGDGAADDAFGGSVSIYNEYAVVGAKSDDDSRGSAYIFNKDDGGTDNWGQVKKLTDSNGVDLDYFGSSVSIYGDYIVVGAHGDGGEGTNAGTAFVFNKDEGGTDNWGQQKQITGSGINSHDRFGISVSISGNNVIVGAYGGGQESYAGEAYIFNKDEGGTDNWGEVDELNASDYAGYDHFGRAVSISGYYSIVGAYRNDDTEQDSGSAYIFNSEPPPVPEFADYMYIIAIALCVGIMYKVIPKFST